MIEGVPLRDALQLSALQGVRVLACSAHIDA